MNDNINACYMCDNARINEELSDDNDLSFCDVGESNNGYRMLVRSGDRKPLCVQVEKWLGDHWKEIGLYRPRFCPNCGREIVEYPRKERE